MHHHLHIIVSWHTVLVIGALAGVVLLGIALFTGRAAVVRACGTIGVLGLPAGVAGGMPLLIIAGVATLATFACWRFR